LGVGPEGTMVAGLVAGICRVFPLPIYVWQKTRQDKQLHSDFGDYCDCDNTIVGKSIENFPRIT
jgi:hypothetical protein